MKRGKDDEKMMGPMFPRLHVNDTEKGGPRAPPRNKMALYEQLTIPSQRHNSTGVPSKQNNSSNSSLVPSTSTSQGTNRDRNMYFPLYQPPPAPGYEETQIRSREPVNSSNHQVSVDKKRKTLEEDDFMVPIFSQARMEGLNANTESILDGETRRHSYLSTNHPAGLPATVGEETNQSSVGRFLSKQLDLDERTLRVLNSPRRRSFDLSMRGRDDVEQKNDTFASKERQYKPRFSALKETGASLREDHQDSLPAADARFSEDIPDLVGEYNPSEYTDLKLRPNPQAGHGCKSDTKIKRLGDGYFLEKEGIDRGDDVSETTMVDSASRFDITPDDVVDIIGRKHFWKARTAIVNQQRVLAVQVFELHRLIKVQKLIAGSPNLLVESTAFVGKSSLKSSAVKNYSSEFAMKGVPQKVIQKVVVHKATDKVEGTSENVVPKLSAPVPFQQSPIQPAGYGAFSANAASPSPGSMDPTVNPWGFQPSPHQWLMPVMSPSEGLVYKAFPELGFMGPVCGGCGPVGPPQIVGNLMNPSYGMAIHQHQQGMGMPPAIQFGGQGYFPPFGMPMISPSVSGSTVEQLNQFSGPNPYSHMSQPAGGSANFIAQQQSKLSIASDENVNKASVAKSLAPKEGEFQGSTASSPSDRARGARVDPSSERREALPLFCTPSTSEVPNGAPPEENQSRVIRAVPHRSTRESAARMFQSIQDERHQYGSS